MSKSVPVTMTARSEIFYPELLWSSLAMTEVDLPILPCGISALLFMLTCMPYLSSSR
jgi:hypothetical protein